MKHLIIILAILFSVGFTTVVKQENSVQSFKIDISYISLPDVVKTKYSIDNNRLTVYKTQYDTNKDSFVDFNKASFDEFDEAKLVLFLNRIDWKSIPKELVTETIDGFHYTVNIEIENNSYSFEINNTYHPTFDSLFIICNHCCPVKKSGRRI